MKKLLTLILLSIVAFNAIHAEISWNLSDDGTLTISGTEMPNYSSVTYPWYSQRGKIKEIVIEDGVTSIGAYAFYNCQNIVSVTIPNSVSSIGESAFSGCSGLTSITIPNSVTSIGESAFSGCSGLTSITIPNSVTRIEESTFSYCSGLTSITIPNSVKRIGKWAFYGCSGPTSIIVEKGNPKYDSRDNCNAIIETESNTLIAGCKNTIIPNSVTKIGYSAFFRCTGLTSISIPNSVTSIGDGAFYGCTGLTSFTIPNSVISIGELAFNGCYDLTSITIPNSVTSIGKYAFYYCTGLTSVTIPNSVTSIENYTFYNCSSLTSVIISNSVTNIGSFAFSGCSELTSLTIPNSMTSIGESAFSGCSNLTSITIPNSVTSIGESAFSCCSSLTSVTIPNSVTSIGSYAFSGCSALKSITIQNTIKNVGRCIFGNGSTITSITCQTNTPPNIKILNGCLYLDLSIPIYVPANSVETYKKDEEWERFSNIQAIVETENIAFANPNEKLALDRTKKLTAIISPENATNKIITWNSLNTDVATVSSEGLVTAKSLGTTQISATTYNGKTATCTITVEQPVTAIALSETTTSLWVGKTKTLKATASPTTASNTSVEWTSSDDKVASVSSEGVITANGEGTCIITCTAADGYGTKSICEVTVKQQVTGIVLSETTASLWVGETKTLSATVLPTTASNTSVIWSSSDENVASVSSDGMITANGEGSCIITCTAADGYGAISTCEVTVRQQVTEIALNETTASLWVGDTKTITATASPTTASNTSVTWSSSDDNVATVSSEGVITAKGEGTCIITCTAADGYGTKSICEVTVNQQVTEIALSETTASLWVGETKTLSATVSPTTASNTSVEWYSSDDNVASVSSEGVITAKGEGACIITCTASDGYGTKSTCEVTVKQQVTEIALSETNASLWVGDTKTITATALPTTANNTSVEWSSSDDNVATVSSDGVITTNGEGTCIITCTAADGYETKSICEVTVKQQVTEIALSETNASLWVGDTKTLTATVSPTTASNTSVEWSSSDDNVATVSSNGVITANGEGTCTITCTAADGYGTVSICEVTVMQQATSLEDLRFANDKSPVYNLNGQRINKAHAQKGIYIKNGKKYANKN